MRLQSWYGPKKERYWVVDENTSGTGNDDTAKRALENASKRPDEQDEIVKGIRHWQGQATKRRLTLQAKPLPYELDSWLNFTKWHAVLRRSKHDMLRTYEFVRYPEPEDRRLHRLLYAWDMVRARALDTLEDVDHKDALKWWVSPKNEMACQNPFELPQSAKTLDKYSRT